MRQIVVSFEHNPVRLHAATAFGVLAIALVSGLAGCAPGPKPGSDSMSIEKRVESLEGRVESLERRDTIDPALPLRSREAIEANIKALELERTSLLAKYQSAHPDVRSIDRRIALMKKQLEMLDQVLAAPK